MKIEDHDHGAKINIIEDKVAVEIVSCPDSRADLMNMSTTITITAKDKVEFKRAEKAVGEDWGQ